MNNLYDQREKSVISDRLRIKCTGKKQNRTECHASIQPRPEFLAVNIFYYYNVFLTTIGVFIQKLFRFLVDTETY